MPRKRLALSKVAQPLGLFVVGLAFMVIGSVRYPAFLAAGVVFMVVGMRGLQSQRAIEVEADSSDK